MITAAKAVVQALEKEGIQVVFGYPGAAICPFYDSLRESSIHHVLVRQEQNAGHAASGYARMTGKPAVCIATSGPGATNLITALATAYMDSIPMVVITGQVSSELLGRDVFQEADITGAAEPFTKYSFLVKDAKKIPTILKEAFILAGTGRPGPVLIDIPVDVQNTKIPFDYPKTVEIRGYKPSIRGHAIQIKRVAEAIQQASRPIICVGGGIFAAHGMETLTKLCESTQIPVVSTMMGLGVLPTQHPLYKGMVGMHSDGIANLAVSRADLLIVIGARMGDRAISVANALRDATRIIHIDIDPAEIGKNVGTSIPLVGDAATVMEQILQAQPKTNTAPWLEELSQLQKKYKVDNTPRDGFVNPKWMIHKLSQALPDKSVVIADVGQNQIWTANNLFLHDRIRFLTSGGMGTMGYSLPAAIGAKLASPSRQVIVVCGDGSFQMMQAELSTAMQEGLPVKIVVMVNRCLGMVREIQSNAYGGRLSAVDIHTPDLLKLASAYGISGEEISDNAQIEDALKRLLDPDKSYLLVCQVDPMESSL